MELGSKYKLILGSQSPRRKQLLSWIDIPFEIVTADLDEISNETIPSEIAMDLALQKGRCVFDKVSESGNSFVVASDTIVVLDNVLYGKPKDKEEAKAILMKLSGKTHQVLTGVCFIYNDSNGKRVEHAFYDLTDVTFAEISERLLENYIATGDSLDKAGAYGIQGPSLTFISDLKGSYSNVVGFPLDKIIKELTNLFGQTFHQKFI